MANLGFLARGLWIVDYIFLSAWLRVWRARRADLDCVRGEIKEQGDLACGGYVGLRVWRGLKFGRGLLLNNGVA